MNKNIFRSILKKIPKEKIEIVADNQKYQHTADQLGILLNVFEECPNAENKTFEEIAEWAGQHVLLTEENL